MSEPSVTHARAEPFVNWSEDLEEIHEESSRTHFMDVWTRRAMLARLGPVSRDATLIDIGCSSGHLLEDLRRAIPHADLIGVDLIASGLRKARKSVPDATLLEADVCALPLKDASVDGVLTANLLEHVPDDEQALSEIHRIMRPGARGVVVVPVGPGNYDYYDRFLGHERRYAKGELARKARLTGFEVVDDVHIGSLVYPAFWAVKQRNRRFHHHLRGAALERRVRNDIQRTKDSSIGRVACSVEERLLAGGVRLPFGIRGMTVLVRRKPAM
jgi:SAM-dependent methyltransferase